MFQLLVVDTGISIPGVSGWVNTLLSVMVPILSYVIILAVKRKASEIQVNIQTKEMNRKEKLDLRVRQFLLIRASSFVERDFIEIAQGIVTSVASGADKADMISSAKAKLHSLGDNLLVEAKAYFSTEDIDIVKELGEGYLKAAIEWAANKVSPFPGKSTALTMVEGGAQELLEKGSEWTKAQIFNDTE